MNARLFKDISMLNQLSLVQYLDILGYKPIAQHADTTDYHVLLDHVEPVTLTIDHLTNRFTVPVNNRQGTLVDFACLLFDCTSIELCSNIVLYRLDMLMSQSSSTKTALP